jgi:hypothetical protein
MKTALGLDAKKMPDRRHMPIKGMLDQYWQRENPMIPSLPWGAADAGALGSFLRANPAITPEVVAACLEHRLQSEDHAPGERVHRWIGDLLRYAQGPLNRYKQPLQPSRMQSEASVGTYTPGRRYVPTDELPEPLHDVMSKEWQERVKHRWLTSPNDLTDLEIQFLKEEHLK